MTYISITCTEHVLAAADTIGEETGNFLSAMTDKHIEEGVEEEEDDDDDPEEADGDGDDEDDEDEGEDEGREGDLFSPGALASEDSGVMEELEETGGSFLDVGMHNADDKGGESGCMMWLFGLNPSV